MADIDESFEAALARFDGENFDSLGEVDQVLVAIWGLEADVNNGGLHQYFYNGPGDQAFFAPRALRLIGANRMADIVASANAIFGDQGPPRDHDQRQTRLEQIDEVAEARLDSLTAEFYEYPDAISDLLARYLETTGRAV